MPSSLNSSGELELLQRRVIRCTRCSRLALYVRRVAEQKRRMFHGQEYWGRPLPSFGDPEARLLVLGLAPAAHGGNRTGRMFTGDRSGDFLYRALYEAGFASQPLSLDRNDGLKLTGCYVTAALRCAPPDNKPLPEELRNCQPYLEEELRLLRRVRVVLTLGRIAFDTYLRLVYSGKTGGARERGDTAPLRREKPARERPPELAALPARGSLRFAHGASYQLAGFPRLFACYHPSQQNTQTGKLAPAMMRNVLEDIRAFLRSPTDDEN